MILRSAAGADSVCQRVLTVVAVAVLLLGLAGSAGAESPTAKLQVTGAWVRAPAVPGRSSAAFMTLHNQSEQDRKLVRVQTPVADHTEVHETKLGEDGIMRMAPHGPVTVPAGGKVSLAPGGLHVMLMKTAAKVTAGARVPLHLHFDGGQRVSVQAEVVPPGQTPEGVGLDQSHDHDPEGG